MNAQTVLGRLRDDETHVEGLVTVAVDHALTRPLGQLIDPAWLATALAQGVRSVSGSADFRPWLEAQLQRALNQAGKVDGTVGDHIPVTLLAPLQTALAREYVPDPALVRALMDHPSLRELIAAVLEASILEYGKRIKSVVDELPGSRLGSRLAGVARGVASAAGVDKVEDRVRTFVQGMLGRAVDMTIERFCDPAHAPDMATWRQDILGAVMEQPIERLIAEGHKFPPAEVAEDASSMIQALSNWRQLAETVESSLTALLGDFGTITAGEWLADSGLLEAWRPQLEHMLRGELVALVETDEFGGWLGRLMAP